MTPKKSKPHKRCVVRWCYPSIKYLHLICQVKVLSSSHPKNSVMLHVNFELFRTFCLSIFSEFIDNSRYWVTEKRKSSEGYLFIFFFKIKLLKNDTQELVFLYINRSISIKKYCNIYKSMWHLNIFLLFLETCFTNKPCLPIWYCRPRYVEL